MELSVGFGKGTQDFEIEDSHLYEVMMANEMVHELTNEDEVKRGLNNPIGAPLICDVVHPGEKIVIITSDITRPMPTYRVMPTLLDMLYEAGIDKKDITLVFALGSHRAHTKEEMIHLAGERAYNEISCVDGDPDDCVHMGKTAHGTPVDIVRIVAEADRRICLGNIEYHYFAGYSGGAKAIMPGVSTKDAIQVNHSLMVEEAACAGNITTNPIRKDIEEAAAIVGVDYIVNVVLDEHKNIVRCVAGDVTLAHREGCKYLDKMYGKHIKERADIVVVSQGGAPKDLNLYQTQKALDNAKHAVKDGGTVILVGSCKEGLGSETFEEWLTTAEKSSDLIVRVRENFKLGGHKAAAIAMVLEHARIFLVSELDKKLVKDIFMEPYDSVKTALEDAIKLAPADYKVLVMPYGGSTLPLVD